MREEEKLAHDLYSAYGELYDLRIFEHIPMSESNHMEAVLTLLNKFGLEDPVSADAGVFNNPDLQTTYDKLLDSGKLSLVEALKNGAYVEELDILDLEKYLDQTDDESIKLVYSNLIRASHNHLRAFSRVLANNGVTYAPQLMSQEQYEEIIAGEMEHGGNGRGRHRNGRACSN